MKPACPAAPPPSAGQATIASTTRALHAPEPPALQRPSHDPNLPCCPRRDHLGSFRVKKTPGCRGIAKGRGACSAAECPACSPAARSCPRFFAASFRRRGLRRGRGGRQFPFRCHELAARRQPTNVLLWLVDRSGGLPRHIFLGRADRGIVLTRGFPVTPSHAPVIPPALRDPKRTPPCDCLPSTTAP